MLDIVSRRDNLQEKKTFFFYFCYQYGVLGFTQSHMNSETLVTRRESLARAVLLDDLMKFILIGTKFRFHLSYLPILPSPNICCHKYYSFNNYEELQCVGRIFVRIIL